MGSQLAKPVTEKVTERLAGGPNECVSFAASGMQGLRREMEDAHCIVPSMDDGLGDHSFVAIYDGHGGDATANIAAETMLSYITGQPEYKEYCALDDSQREPSLLGRALRSAFLELDRNLPAALVDRQGDASSGSTAVVVVITPTHFVCASCGDSRAVVASRERTDGVAALSEDHKPSLPAETARIEAAGGRVLMDRVDGNLAMSRALGDFELKDEGVDQCLQKVSPEPTIEILRREMADEALIVACDGVWDVMSNAQCCHTVRELLATGETDIGLICEELLDLSLEAGSTDNISAAVVALPGANIGKTEGDGLRVRREAREQARREEDAREKAEHDAEVTRQKADMREQARARMARETGEGALDRDRREQQERLQASVAAQSSQVELFMPTMPSHESTG